MVQLGPRYEGQLNPMAEPIPHEVRPLVRTHVYHPYHAADRQAETDSQWCSRKQTGTGAVQNISLVLFPEREH